MDRCIKCVECDGYIHYDCKGGRNGCEPDDVTCKMCLRDMLNKPEEEEDDKKHCITVYSQRWGVIMERQFNSSRKAGIFTNKVMKIGDKTGEDLKVLET